MPAPAPNANPRQSAINDHKAKRIAARNQRLDLLKKIADARGSTILAYVTSNRQILNGQIGLDAIRLFREQLGAIGKSNKLDLLLITRGGHTLAPLRLMSLLREFANSVFVLIPYMAHSAGTLISLGANEIVMGAMGELGPVDPSVTNQFNPILDQADIQGTNQPKPRPRIPISVEDVTSYLNFAKSHAKLDADGMAGAYSALTSQVHPLALGNILRHHNLIRHLARQLLLMHMDAEKEKEKVDSIVRTLTEELYAHDYIITRTEAPKIGLKVAAPSADVEGWMWDLFRSYETWLGIDKGIDIGAELGAESQKYLCFDIALIESQGATFAYSMRGVGSKGKQNNFDFNLEAQGWEQA